MAPPKWKLLLDFDHDSHFHSRPLNSAKVCPCRYCWSIKCRGKTSGLGVSDLCSIPGFNCSTNRKISKEPPPKWKLVLIFKDGSEFSSRLQKCEICPCIYCWCGRHGTTKLQQSDLGAFQKFLPTKVEDSLEELLSIKNQSCKVPIKITEAESNQVGTKPKEAQAENVLEKKSLDSKASGSIQESPTRRSSRISRQKAPQVPLKSPKSNNTKTTRAKSETSKQPEEPEEKDSVLHSNSPVKVPKESPASEVPSNPVDAEDKKKPEVKPEQPLTFDHRQTHFKKRSQGFHCYECPKRFQRKSVLDQHLKEHNSHPFKCYLCPLRFKTRKENSAHLRSHTNNTGEKPFQCTQCEKSFNHRHHLKAHMLHHTGERPFKCDQCALTFTHSGSLSNHRTRHRNVPFTCDQCSESFVHQRHLRDHKRRIHLKL